ncbi:hypothetical protein HCDSEM_057 [Candidatus Hodgkinia cicadicola Dsem]|nr:hypothetical protein HCDSEM_057 [Candidatus Hodgkinia cicadicola Dsem]
MATWPPTELTNACSTSAAAAECDARLPLHLDDSLSSASATGARSPRLSRLAAACARRVALVPLPQSDVGKLISFTAGAVLSFKLRASAAAGSGCKLAVATPTRRPTSKHLSFVTCWLRRCWRV